MYMSPIDTDLMQVNHMLHLFFFEDKCFIVTLLTPHPPSSQSFKAGNLDSRSVFIQRYQAGKNKQCDPQGEDQGKVQLREE